jgi:hypothetical protein
MFCGDSTSVSLTWMTPFSPEHSRGTSDIYRFSSTVFRRTGH